MQLATVKMIPADEEKLAARALKLGARYATVRNLMFPLRPNNEGIPSKRMEAIASELGVRRVSGQTPRNALGLLLPQVKVHTTVFVLMFDATPSTMLFGARVLYAYEAYAALVARITANGEFIGLSGQVVHPAHSDREHPALPPLSLDRVAHFAHENLRKDYGHGRNFALGKCRSCHAPMALGLNQKPATYSCVSCTRRMTSGRAKKRAA